MMAAALTRARLHLEASLGRSLKFSVQSMADQQQNVASSTVAQERKQTARKAIKTALQQMSREAMQAESAAIARQVLKAPYFTASKTIAVYVHCARLREVDTSAVLQAAMTTGKRCYVPVVEDKQSNMKFLHLDSLSSLVSVPPFGILEPPPTYADGTPRADVLQEGLPLDILLMPGLGFDTSGNRLGRGGGYYDKALERLIQTSRENGRRPPLLVGLAYSCQVVPEVPVDDHDKKVNVLITPSEMLDFQERTTN